MPKEISVKELWALERQQKSRGQKVLDRVVSTLPLLAGGAHLLEYLLVLNHGTNSSTNIYTWFLAAGIAAWLVLYIVSFWNEILYDKLRHKAALYTVLFLLLMAYDLATLKSGTLILPYFPWIDRVLNAIYSDRIKLLDCAYHSLQLLFTGYFFGIAAGLICGIGAGWSKKINYWIQPLVRVLGAIPTTTYMPIVMILATSLFGGSVFLIALGVWFPVTVSAMTGVSNINAHYYEVAETLGTSKIGILFRVVIPASMPTIFGGLTQGMSVACLTLMMAEMMGVESGLGWYINWQKGWAEFAKMYGAIVIICLIFVLVNAVLNRIKRIVLRWKEGVTG